MTHHGNLLRHLPASGPDEVFETLVRTPGLHIARIVSTGQTTPAGEWYDQDQDEFVLLLAGTAQLAFEDGSVRELETGSWVWIPARQRHRVTATSREPPAVWLAVFNGSGK